MAEGGPTAHVPERRGYGSYEGEATPAPGDLADRDFAAGMPNGKWPADITRDQGRGWEGRASRRRSTAATAGSSHVRPVPVPTRTLADRMLVRAAETPPEGVHPPGAFRPRMATAGGPDGWRSWTATAWHGRRAPRAVPRTTPPRRGFLGRMKTESVHPEHWEERTRSEALVPVDDCIRWHDHERIRRPLGWMSPVRYRQSQGMAA